MILRRGDYPPRKQNNRGGSTDREDSRKQILEFMKEISDEIKKRTKDLEECNQIMLPDP